MIKWGWRRSLTDTESVELAAVLDRAGKDDAEPGYSTIAFADVKNGMAQSNPAVQHLVIWMPPSARTSEEPPRIVGLLRLVVGVDGAAEAVIVIDPPARCLGITTLLIEQAGLDTTGTDGWLGTGADAVSGWARGDHPAVGRLANRFLIPRTQLVWKLIRSATCIGDDAAPPLQSVTAEVLDELGWVPSPVPTDRVHGLCEGARIVACAAFRREPVDSEEFGPCTVIHMCAAAPDATVPTLQRLLDGAAAVAQHDGLSGVIIHVDSDATELVNACRLTGFQHSRTDVRLRFGA